MRQFATLGLSLLCCTCPLEAHAQRTGRIEGMITDSLHARPLTGATVQATRLDAGPETTFVAVTDARGHFSFESVNGGRYAVSFTSALLDSLEFGGPVPQTLVVAGQTSRIALALPSGKSLRAIACPGVEFPANMGVLMGHLSDAETERPLGGADVLVAWTGLTADSVTHRAVPEDRLTRTTADAEGRYRLCGVPTGEWLIVQVQHAGRAGSVLRLSIADDVGVVMRNLSFSAQGSRSLAAAAQTSELAPLRGTAAVTGTVRSSSGSPVAEAFVGLNSAGVAVRSDERGWFSMHGLPAGTHDLEVRQIGYRVERRPLELRSGVLLQHDIQLERVVALDSVAVRAKRTPYAAFESRRRDALEGKFLNEEEIAKLNAKSTAQIAATIPWYRVVGEGGNAEITSTRGGCSPLIVVDYVRARHINEVQPSLIGAMEFYPGATSAPIAFRSACGTIMIWTKY